MELISSWEGEVTRLRENRLARKEQLFRTLRRRILAARLKGTLDRELGRETSSAVKRLAAMDLPSIAKPTRAGKATDRMTRRLTRKHQLLRTLRREIPAARLKVTLDEQLNRKTSPAVRRLAAMELPPRIRPPDRPDKDEVFAELRRQILAARVSVTLNDQLGRETSPRLGRLAGMKLPRSSSQ